MIVYLGQMIYINLYYLYLSLVYILMSLKEKQDYLYRQIIQADYDPQRFQDYMQKQKGINLELYTLQQIIHIVKKFTNSDKQQQTSLEHDVQSKKQIENQEQMVERKIKIEEKQKNQRQFELKNHGNLAQNKQSWNSTNKSYHQLLKKTDVSSLFKNLNIKERIQVKIRSFSKSQDDNLFKNQYINYMIETPSKGWNVKRRYSDFEWLHSKLSEMYPGLPIPPIAKKTTMRYFNDNHLEERMIIFQKCINKILQIPQIGSDLIVEQFLRVASPQEFNLCKGRFEVRLNNLGNKIYSLKGQQLLDMTIFEISQQNTSIFTNSHQMIQELNTKIQAFQKSLRLTTQKAFQLASSFNEAYKKFKRDNFKGSKILQSIGQFINQMGSRMDNEYFFIRNNIQNYFCYEQKYLSNINSHISKLAKAQQQIKSKSKGLSISSVNFQNQEQISKNKAMSDFLSSKQVYRIKMSFLNEQIQRYKHNNLMIFASQWHQSLTHYVGSMKNMMLSGVDQLTKVMCIVEGKQLVQVQYLNPKPRGERTMISQEH